MENTNDKSNVPQSLDDCEEAVQILRRLPENDRAFIHVMAVAFQLQADVKASA